MTDTLRRLARLRHLEETQAQQLLAEARDAKARCDAESDALLARMADLRDAPAADAGELARLHASTLRLEMARRRQVRQSQAAEGRVERSMVHLQRAAQASRKADRFVEVAEERQEREASKAEQKHLDAVGTQSWLRRRAA